MPPPGEFALSRSTLLLSSRVHLLREKALGKAQHRTTQGLEERVPGHARVLSIRLTVLPQGVSQGQSTAMATAVETQPSHS